MYRYVHTIRLYKRDIFFFFVLLFFQEVRGLGNQQASKIALRPKPTLLFYVL